MRQFNLILLVLMMISSLGLAQSWESIGPESGRIVQVAADPNRPDTIFAVHEGFSEPSHFLIRSLDGGERWDTLGEYNGFALHPSSPETLLATLGIGSFSDGIYKSEDLGESFDPSPFYTFYLASGANYNPDNPRNIFCWGQGLIYTTDGGGTWGRPSFPTIPMMYYGAFADPFAQNHYWGWTDSGLLIHSPDRGETWPAMHTFHEGSAPIDVAVSAIDTSYVYMANWDGISRSLDYGETWEHIHMPSQPSNCIWVSELNPDEIIFGGAYGVYKSADGGESWELVGDSVEYEVIDIDIIPLGGGGGYRIYIGTARNGVMFIDTSPFSSGPMISGAWPPNGKWVSMDTFDITIKVQDPDGVEVSSIELEVNGTSYTTADPELAFLDTMLVFTGYFEDDETVEVELVSAEDALGNPSAVLPYNWSFTIDRTPPTATYVNPIPDDTVGTEPMLFKMHVIDGGCGLNLPSYVSHFNSVTVYSSCTSFLFDADTVLIDLAFAGLTLEEGDTIQVNIYIEDSVDIGDPNVLEDEWFFYVARTGIADRELPENNELRISPNPFNAGCRIETSEDFRIYDTSGRLIMENTANEGSADRPSAIWSGIDEMGTEVPSGIYLIRTSGGETARVILLR